MSNLFKIRPWTTTLIKDFEGDISFDVSKDKCSDKCSDFSLDEQCSSYHSGNCGTEESVKVVGRGNINFRTSQTGF